ncbi:hypothetical protein CU098_013126, partial [Rhizopus stolonifer]
MELAREYIGERVTKNVLLSLIFLYGYSLVYKGTGLKENRRERIYQTYELLESKCISHLPFEGHCRNCFWTELRINSHRHEMSLEITARKRAQESVENMLDEKRLLHQRIKSLSEQYEILMENYRQEIVLKINAQESLNRTLDEKRVLIQRIKNQTEQYQRLSWRHKIIWKKNTVRLFLFLQWYLALLIFYIVGRSMSGVLVLQKRHDYQSLPVDLFPSEMQKTIGRYMIDTFYNAKPFNSQQASQAKDILM